MLNEWLNPSDSDSDEEEASQKATSEVSNTKVTSNNADAFDELFNS